MAKTGIMEQIAAQREKTIEQLVTDAYKEAGSLNGAAKALGVNRHTIRYYLAKFGYESEETKAKRRLVKAKVKA
jgi:hypothetical protein